MALPGTGVPGQRIGSTPGHSPVGPATYAPPRFASRHSSPHRASHNFNQTSSRRPLRPTLLLGPACGFSHTPVAILLAHQRVSATGRAEDVCLWGEERIWRRISTAACFSARLARRRDFPSSVQIRADSFVPMFGNKFRAISRARAFGVARGRSGSEPTSFLRVSP